LLDRTPSPPFSFRRERWRLDIFTNIFSGLPPIDPDRLTLGTPVARRSTQWAYSPWRQHQNLVQKESTRMLKKLTLIVGIVTLAFFAATAPAVSDEADVESFVEAFQEIGQIEHQLNAQLQQTENPERAGQLQQQAQQQMLGVLENNDLSVSEYNGMIQRMNTDPEFQQLVTNKLQQ
jgi:hypothetical protein